MTTTATHALSIRYAAETLFENKQGYEVRRSAFETIVALAGELAAENKALEVTRELDLITLDRLRSKNKALEERVHSLKGAMMGALAHLDNTQGARDWLLDKLKADDAKAAGEPECEHPNRETRFEWCKDCGAGPELTESEEHELAQMAKANDDHASRRQRTKDIVHALGELCRMYDETEQSE